MEDIKYLTNAEAAQYLNIHPNTLVIWRMRGTGPTFYKMGRNVRYRKEDLDKYMETLKNVTEERN